MTVEQKLADIKTRIRQAEIDRAKVEAQAEAARNQVREATELLMEMGCESIEEAKARIKALEKSIESRIEEIRQLL